MSNFENNFHWPINDYKIPECIGQKNVCIQKCCSKFWCLNKMKQNDLEKKQHNKWSNNKNHNNLQNQTIFHIYIQTILTAFLRVPYVFWLVDSKRTQNSLHRFKWFVINTNLVSSFIYSFVQALFLSTVYRFAFIFCNFTLSFTCSTNVLEFTIACTHESSKAIKFQFAKMARKKQQNW